MADTTIVLLINKLSFFSDTRKVMAFGTCSKPDEYNISVQVNRFYYCREQIIHHLFNSLGEFSKHGKVSSTAVDLDNCRVIVRRAMHNNILANESKMNKYISKFRSDILNGVKIINAYEEYHQWPLTTVTKVRHDGSGNQLLYMVVGPSQWLKAPFLVSLWLLMLRMGIVIKTNYKKYENVEQLDDKIKAWCNRRRRSTDLKFITATHSYWHLVMHRYKDIIAGAESEVIWNCNPTDGIHKLCGNGYSIARVRSNFENICKSALEENHESTKGL